MKDLMSDDTLLLESYIEQVIASQSIFGVHINIDEILASVRIKSILRCTKLKMNFIKPSQNKKGR